MLLTLITASTFLSNFVEEILLQKRLIDNCVKNVQCFPHKSHNDFIKSARTRGKNLISKRVQTAAFSFSRHEASRSFLFHKRKKYNRMKFSSSSASPLELIGWEMELENFWITFFLDTWDTFFWALNECFQERFSTQILFYPHKDKRTWKKPWTSFVVQIYSRCLSKPVLRESVEFVKRLK